MIISNKKQFIIFFLILILMILTIAFYFFKLFYTDYEVLESENILENVTTNPYQNNVVENSLGNSEDTIEDVNDDDSSIVVHVTGAVHNSGIVKLPSGSRIADAINSAGGFTDDSDVSSINLAYKLEDGEKIYIPYITDDISDGDLISSDAGKNVILEDFPNNSINSISPNVELVNINSATQTELETIPGIGPSTALKIIEYRAQNGKFTNINEIMNINRNW